jgi:uncharacterized protein (TIGR04255 family)
VTKMIPKRLKKEPLLEALWEIRFNSDRGSVVELLPGIIYQTFKDAYPKIDRLPAADLPPAILQQDLMLRYAPTVKLAGSSYSIQIGEHVVSLSCQRPYTGWEKFKTDIIELSEKLKETGLITRPERFSLKYIDIIPVSSQPSIEPLEIELKLGVLGNIHNHPVQLRTEIRENGFVHIIQIVTPAQASIPSGELFNGVMFDIDTICQNNEVDFWTDFSDKLDKAHEYSKNLFFNLLKDDTIKQLEPEY